MDHLRFSGISSEEQRTAFLTIVAFDPLVSEALQRARDLDLPEWLIVSGVLYNTVWNRLTGKPSGYGIKDVDLFYFDPDLSYEAEDTVIRRSALHFDGLARPVEVRNQARVHLWYKARFGSTYPRLSSASDALNYFASKTHAVGVRFGEKGFELVAPFGLDDIFSFRVTPNTVLDNRRTHQEKGARARAYWPEVAVLPW
jgi:hypothetical protein